MPEPQEDWKLDLGVLGENSLNLSYLKMHVLDQHLLMKCNVIQRESPVISPCPLVHALSEETIHSGR